MCDKDKFTAACNARENPSSKLVREGKTSIRVRQTNLVLQELLVLEARC